MSDTRLIVVVSDIHAGSSVGLLPPGFTLLEGQRIGLNAIQEWLWKCWLDCDTRLKKYIGKDSFALVINGDHIEGTHHGTKQIISADVSDHHRAATQILAPLAKRAKKVFVVEGTECHTGTKEHTLAETIDAIPDPNTKKAAWERLSLNACGVRCVFQHHISPTTREYLKGTALSIFLGNEQLAAAKSGEEIPRVLGCAHRHAYDSFRDHTGLCFVTPAWQVLTRHGNKVVPAARVNVGMVVLDWRKRNDGELPDLEPILCRAPAAESAVL